jgi:thiamine biosynthesis lipoprotein
MGTTVTIEIVGHSATERDRRERLAAVQGAAGWFHAIEEVCTRFDPKSELSQLSTHIGVPVRVSVLLFEAVQFALTVAEETSGAFDPTIGRQLETRGFNVDSRSGRTIRTLLDGDDPVSYRDVHLDSVTSEITLQRPLLLDLGAVAKGLAIDIAARELARFEDFAIDAGGDLYLAGRNVEGEPWAIGIEDPRTDHHLVETLRVSDAAVCTSGDYRRHTDARHHIIDPRSGATAAGLASVTVIAPSAMLADALGTAAFVLGPTEGLALLQRHGAEGLLLTSALERFATAGVTALEQHAPA